MTNSSLRTHSAKVARLIVVCVKCFRSSGSMININPGSFAIITEMRRKKKEFCEGIKDFAQKELGYLGERAEFWMQQKTPNPPRRRDAGSVSSSRTSEILRALEDLEDGQCLCWRTVV